VTAYLKVEKPRFLFLEGSAVAAAAPATAAAVAVLPDASAAHAELPRRAPLLQRTAPWQVRQRPPRAPVPLPPLWLLAMGVRAPTSRGEPAPVTLLLLRRRRGVLWGRRGRESLLLAQPVFLANMASYAISSSFILVIHDNMMIGTNLIV
jgi:hypothetical protein